MADKSRIEWTEATWNPITGCSVVSPGCTNCYAMRLAGGRLRNHPSRAGLTIPTKAGPVWNGEVRFNEQWLGDPVRWTRPRMIFVCAHGDLFHESVPDEWIDQVFAVMAAAPQHTFQILTKRSARMRQYLTVMETEPHWATARRFADAWPRASVLDVEIPFRNVNIGVSVEDQPRADERIPDLLATPAALQWVSIEPLLGPVDVSPWLSRCHWIVVGGESGRRARPMHPDWARSIRDQCTAAGVPFFFKQWGEFDSCGMSVGKKAAGRLLDGVEHNGLPAGEPAP